MEQEWPRQEQRALCRACQEAVADGQLAEVVRLLQRPQLGQQIVDKDLAWHLLEVQCLTLHFCDFTDTFMLYTHPLLPHSWAFSPGMRQHMRMVMGFTINLVKLRC